MTVSDWKKNVEQHPTIPPENLAYVHIYTTNFIYLLIRVVNDCEFNKNLADSCQMFPKFVGIGYRGEPDWYDELPGNHASFSKDRKDAKRFGKCVIEQSFGEYEGAFDLSSVSNIQNGEKRRV